MKNRALKPAHGWFLLGLGILLLLTAADQFTKYLAIRFLREKSALVLLPGVLQLSYLENRGMAFGLFEGQIFFFLAVCVAFFVTGSYVLLKMPKTRTYRPLAVSIDILLAGALGNFIDRCFRGYVVDFIDISLIHFPTFNLADIYVTCGAALFVLLIFVRYREEEAFDFLKPGK